jgi:hypothetical protein
MYLRTKNTHVNSRFNFQKWMSTKLDKKKSHWTATKRIQIDLYFSTDMECI